MCFSSFEVAVPEGAGCTFSRNASVSKLPGSIQPPVRAGEGGAGGDSSA